MAIAAKVVQQRSITTRGIVVGAREREIGGATTRGVAIVANVVQQRLITTRGIVVGAREQEIS
ncbi:hypothetical protein [Paenibacillus sp. PL2-23]|uniref:hypothetical protein n=1 Tax=Paenibacillus sp. PL2-23 TaxID=2100729 RepID=UPI0030F58066